MTELLIRPLLEAEQKYTYRQSQQLKMQCGVIGYLRGDFAKSGTEFHSTWFDEVKSHKTPEFSAQFDDVVNALRETGGLLENRKAMLSVCNAHQTEAKFLGEPSRPQYGFCAEHGEQTYLARCNPTVTDDYNFYIFAYQTKWLTRNIEHAAKGIRFIDSSYKTLFYVQDGDSISVTREGETNRYVCRYIDEAHLEVGSELYHICQFAEIMERNGNTCTPVSPFIKSLPVMCYAVQPTSDVHGELVEVRNGYGSIIPYPAFGDIRKTNQLQADSLNQSKGVTKPQAAAMLYGCLHGWDLYGANPAHYDINGQPQKKKPSREIER